MSSTRATPAAEGSEQDHVLSLSACGALLCLRGPSTPDLRAWAEAVRAEISAYYVPRKVGWLEKRSAKSDSAITARMQHRIWRRRYFVLCRGVLSYYADDSLDEYCGEFDLDGCDVLRDHYAKLSSSVSNLLIVRSQNFTLKLGDADDSWLNALEQARHGRVATGDSHRSEHRARVDARCKVTCPWWWRRRRISRRRAPGRACHGRRGRGLRRRRREHSGRKRVRPRRGRGPRVHRCGGGSGGRRQARVQGGRHLHDGPRVRGLLF